MQKLAENSTFKKQRLWLSVSLLHGKQMGKKVEAVAYLIFLGCKITVDSDFSHEIKRCLLLERKAMTKLDSTLKSRDFTLPTKVHIVKAMVFPVVMYRCQSWTIKKAECRRIDIFFFFFLIFRHSAFFIFLI